MTLLKNDGVRRGQFGLGTSNSTSTNDISGRVPVNHVALCDCVQEFPLFLLEKDKKKLWNQGLKNPKFDLGEEIV